MRIAMLLRLRQLSLKQKVYTVFLPTFITGTFGVSLYQGIQLRNNYLLNQQLETPHGPTKGVIKWVDETITTQIDKKLEVLDRITTRIKTIKNDIHSIILNEINTTAITITNGVACSRGSSISINHRSIGSDSTNSIQSTKNMIIKRSSLKSLQHNMLKERLYIPLNIGNSDNNDNEKMILGGSNKRRSVRMSRSHDNDDNIDSGQIIPSISGMIRAINNNNSNTNNNSGSCSINKGDDDDIKTTKKKNRMIRLLILGDSLVAGVGNDDIKLSPTLPQAIASMLCSMLRIDVEWISCGIVGGTVVDIRERVLPEMRKVLSMERSARHTLTRHHNNDSHDSRENHHDNCSSSSGSDDVNSSSNCNNNHDNNSCDGTLDGYNKDGHNNVGDEVDLIVVIICGLNDWKEVFLRFPYNYNYGPSSFKNHLTHLIDDVKAMSDQLNYKCKIYLPTVPSDLLSSDPNFSLNVKPLWYFVQFFSNLWDLQKQHIAFDDNMKQITCIGTQAMDKDYAKPGTGNVCVDGIHPTSQGYRWYGQHIADNILTSLKE